MIFRIEKLCENCIDRLLVIRGGILFQTQSKSNCSDVLRVAFGKGRSILVKSWLHNFFNPTYISFTYTNAQIPSINLFKEIIDINLFDNIFNKIPLYIFLVLKERLTMYSLV